MYIFNEIFIPKFTSSLSDVKLLASSMSM